MLALTSERFKKAEIQHLWSQLVEKDSPDQMNKYRFREHFESMSYKGTSQVAKIN